jgi:hypothetical protein
MVFAVVALIQLCLIFVSEILPDLWLTYKITVYPFVQSYGLFTLLVDTHDLHHIMLVILGFERMAQ